MKTLTVRLPDSLIQRIEREAESRRVSKSDIVRESLAAWPTARQGHPLTDLLEANWQAKVPAGPPRFRSAKKQKLSGIIRAKKLHR